MCDHCGYRPCACDYIRSLLPGGAHHDLHDVAAEMLSKPQPHRGPDDTSCPCPECWSARAGTWEEMTYQWRRRQMHAV